MYNVSVLNVRAQWPDERSIVEPWLVPIRTLQFNPVQFIQSTLSHTWHWIGQTQFTTHIKILKTQFTIHINTQKYWFTIHIYTLKNQNTSTSTIKYNKLHNTPLISTLIKMHKGDQW